MSFRFVALSAQQLSDVIPVSSPLNKSSQVITTASCSDPNDVQLSNPTDLLPVGLLLISEHRKVVSGSATTATSYTMACIRQMPLFLRAGILGIFVPFDQKIEDYSGVYLYTAQNMPNLEQVVNTIRAITKDTTRDFAPTAVEFRSFDPKYVQTTHLDLVRNIVMPTDASNGTIDPNQAKSSASDQTQAQSASPPSPPLFFLSNIQISYLATLRDHFVGFIELDSRKWPIFLDGGYLCLKMSSYESLLTDFPFWIDSFYRIRLGHFDPNPKCLPAVHFTTMRIVLPSAFEYEYTYAKELLIIGPDAIKPKFNPVPERIDNQASWHDAAGISFVPRASNTLNWQGQIPHNFPVIETRPMITPEPWLPKFVHQALDDALKCHRNLVQSSAQSSGNFELASVCPTCKPAPVDPKIGQKPSCKAKSIPVVASQNQAAGGRGNSTQSQSEQPSQNRAQAKDTKKGTERGKDDSQTGGGGSKKD